MLERRLCGVGGERIFPGGRIENTLSEWKSSVWTCIPPFAGVDFSTGSLGHGLSAAAGMAYAAKKDGKRHKVYVVLGDGECNEGSVWEAAMFANHFRLNNLVCIVDHNHMASLDFNENTIEIEDFGAKWSAFGWNVIEINGNDHKELKEAFRKASEFSSQEVHKPTVIIANTIKGCGVSFMQNDILWHYRFPHDGWEYTYIYLPNSMSTSRKE